MDELLNQRLEEALHAPTADVHLPQVEKIACEYSPIDLAYVASRLPPSARPVVYDNIPSWKAKVEFFINTDSTTRSAVFRHLEDEGVKELIEEMPADEAVWVLDNLPDRRIRRLLEALTPEHANDIKELQQHDRNSAGRMMTNEFFAFAGDVTIGEAALFIRNNPGIALTRRVFVLNGDGELEGYISDRSLIINPPELPLSQVMRPVRHKVQPDATRQEVVELAERYKIPALPVVDEEDKLVGVIAYEEVVDALEDLADETMAQMAGTLEDVSAHDPIFKRFLSRAPWLIVTLCAGLINAGNMSFFEGMLSPWMAFAIFFVPLIMGMSGNVGVQCSTVLVRGMALGHLTNGRKEAIIKEISIGLLTGLVFGIICGFAVSLLKLGPNPVVVGTIVSCGLFGACVVATFLGVFSPLFFERIGVDPAVSSGPIVTAFNDVLSMAMYFVIAQAISGFFF